MNELADFSVETDTTVLLEFRDGTRLRTPVKRLPLHLVGKDLDRVRAAVKLRKVFLRDHLPKEGLAIALAVILCAVGIAGTNRLAGARPAQNLPAVSPLSASKATSISTPNVIRTTPEVAGVATVAPPIPAANRWPNQAVSEQAKTDHTLPTSPTPLLANKHATLFDQTVDSVTGPVARLLK
jgi:hypothetical protein